MDSFPAAAMTLLPHKPEDVRRLDPGDEVPLATGSWFWVRELPRPQAPGMHPEELAGLGVPEPTDPDEPGEWLGCLTYLGSNYAELTAWHSHHRERVHLDAFAGRCRPEPDADAYIRQQAGHWQKEAQRLIGEVHELTARLGVGEQRLLAVQPEPGTAALARLSGGDRIGEYREALTRAKQTDLPDLFKQIESANEQLARWLKAPLIPLMAEANRSKRFIASVEDRIFNVSLYGGLTETVVQIRDGDPAPTDTPVSVFQRRLCMDEECLAAYRTGGMDFRDVEAFDRWLLAPDNLQRLLPFPRTVVAFQIRRNTKERAVDSILDYFINLEFARNDKATWLYLRNGDRVWRLRSETDFGELLFDRTALHPGTPLYGELSWSKDSFSGEFITAHEYEEQAAALEQLRRTDLERWRKQQAWARDNPDESWIDNPHRDPWNRYTDAAREHAQYEPFTPASVWFDDMLETRSAQIAAWNRVALVLQGLLDRSPVFHPHPPWKLWTPDGFAAAIKLVRDGDLTLYDGPEPDLAAYVAAANASLGVGSLTIGQDDFWAEVEAARLCARMDRSRHQRDNRWRPTRHRPYDNPGPGYIATVEKWQKRARRATFSWSRPRQTSTWTNRRGESLPVSLVVPDERLFNLSAYKPGDFRQFFADPRSRAKYLAWAPILLSAEEYLNGNLDPQTGRTKHRSVHEVPTHNESGVPGPAADAAPGDSGD